MLQTNIAPFNHLVNILMVRGLLQDNIHICIEEEQCSFIVLDITSDFKWFTTHGEDPLKEYPGTSRKSYMLLESSERTDDQATIFVYSNSNKDTTNLLMVFTFQGEQLYLVVHDMIVLHRGLKICSWHCCISLIPITDDTHVTARLPRSKSDAKMGEGRKYYTSRNFLAIVDFKLISIWNLHMY
jgi:hypothetical protein